MTCNHLSRLDTPIVMSITDRNDLVAIVAKKYQEKTIFNGSLIKWERWSAMDREKIDFAAVREALDYLRQGVIVGIAPREPAAGTHKG